MKLIGLYILTAKVDPLTVRVKNVKMTYVPIQIKKKVSNFHPYEDVGRGSETQLQVDEKINDNLY